MGPILAGIASAVGGQLATGGFSLFFNWTDKVGFDLDKIGRERFARELCTQTYNRTGGKKNFIIYNMHLPVEQDLRGEEERGTVMQGKGGGFVVVIFSGSGWFKNNGDRGYCNWITHGSTQTQRDNVITWTSR